MKKIALFLVCLLALCHTASPKWNCLDKSKHLQESYDTKSYAPPKGGCTCDCDQEQARGLHSQKRDTCIKCTHSHDPGKQYIVDSLPKKQSNASGIWYKNPRASLKALIARYRQKNQGHPLTEAN